MKRSLTLRTQLTLLMALLVFLQSLALVLALAVSRVFFMLDAEAFRLFGSTTSARMQSFNASVGALVGAMAEETGTLGARLNNLAGGAGLAPARLYTDDGLYGEAALVAGESLVKLLAEANVTGAFFMLGGSNSNKGNGQAHSAVYIRNSTPESSGGTANYLLEVGPIAVSRQYQMATSVRWDLDVRFEGEDAAQYAFYHRPIEAAAQAPGAEVERLGYWSAPSAILGDSQQVVCYTMPLRDAAGEAYGVLGIEISLAYFTQFYLPNTDLPYENSFYAITAVQGDDLLLDWFIPSGPLAQVYLKQGEALHLTAVQGVDLYETRLEVLGEMYCSVQPLTMYSRNSPFYAETWSLVGFVPQSVLHESSSGVRSTLIFSIIGTTLIAIAAIFVLVYVSTRKIRGLSKYVSGLSPHQDIQFQRTGMREIDELTSAVERLNQSVINASKTTSKILELTLLPIGGFEVSSEAGGVILTGFIHQLLHLAPGQQLSREEWEERYAALTARPAEGYDHIFRYADPAAEETRWLRILETPTDTGRVGVVLDVTKDIEEHRRLAHELDYDALTHLYNRTAFKREAHQRIQSAPDRVGAMIFSDLDNLKYINDTFGHDMGDRLIIRAGEMFREFERRGGVVSRISGDEFAIYLHGFATIEEARQAVEEQYRENEAYSLITPDGSSHRIRSSSGIAWYPKDSDNVTDLLKLSDFAMYEAKHNQKGAVFEFDRQSYQENAYLLENREAINRLLDEGLIRFAFQPIVDLKTGEVFAYEALMRPLLDNFKSPMEILTVAAAQSKLGQLERLVMLTAFQTVAEHIDELGDIKVFVNSIPSQMLTEEDHLLLQRRYAHLLKNMVIEITEAESNSPRQLNTKLSFVHKSDMLLAVDDFGSGYSNEMRILQLDPDIVKIDIAMIQGIHHNTDLQQLVTNLVSFCHPKGIRLVAEGVEDYEDLAELVRLGMDFVQGYYTGRPAFEFTTVAPEIKAQILALQAEKRA